MTFQQAQSIFSVEWTSKLSTHFRRSIKVEIFTSNRCWTFFTVEISCIFQRFFDFEVACWDSSLAGTVGLHRTVRILLYAFSLAASSLPLVHALMLSVQAVLLHLAFPSTSPSIQLLEWWYWHVAFNAHTPQTFVSSIEQVVLVLLGHLLPAAPRHWFSCQFIWYISFSARKKT